MGEVGHPSGHRERADQCDVCRGWWGVQGSCGGGIMQDMVPWGLMKHLGDGGLGKHLGEYGEHMEVGLGVARVGGLSSMWCKQTLPTREQRQL